MPRRRRRTTPSRGKRATIFEEASTGTQKKIFGGKDTSYKGTQGTTNSYPKSSKDRGFGRGTPTAGVQGLLTHFIHLPSGKEGGNARKRFSTCTWVYARKRMEVGRKRPKGGKKVSANDHCRTGTKKNESTCSHQI